jgi:hypothetical protein
MVVNRLKTDHQFQEEECEDKGFKALGRRDIVTLFKDKKPSGKDRRYIAPDLTYYKSLQELKKYLNPPGTHSESHAEM